MNTGDASPAKIFHEMAHAWHYGKRGQFYSPILDAYNNAIENNLYINVRREDGKVMSADALRNEYEYFAELSETYFWRNDFFPYNRN